MWCRGSMRLLRSLADRCKSHRVPLRACLTPFQMASATSTPANSLFPAAALGACGRHDRKHIRDGRLGIYQPPQLPRRQGDGGAAPGTPVASWSRNSRESNR